MELKMCIEVPNINVLAELDTSRKSYIYVVNKHLLMAEDC